MPISSGIAKTFKKLPLETTGSSIASLLIMGTSLKGKYLSPEGANSYL